MNRDEMRQAEWYAVSTRSRHEKVAFGFLQAQRITAFLPLYSTTQKWRNGIRATVELPLFPGYLFVRANLQDRLTILQAPGVARFVGFGGLPAVISEMEIERLRSGLVGLEPEPCAYVKVGDTVRVKAGPLAGLQGTILTKKSQTRFVLAMDLLMRAISVEMDATNLEPIPSDFPQTLITSATRSCVGQNSRLHHLHP